MKEITSLLIYEYNLKNIDFMGYYFDKSNATYHHLIIPRRLGGKETIENGAVLNGKTSHPYLHAIETRNLEIFDAITWEIIDQKDKGYLDLENLKKIRRLLYIFEREYKNSKTAKGKLLIKKEYISKRIDL